MYIVIVIFMWYNCIKGGDIMSVSKAQKEATKRFEDKRYDKILLRLTKGKKEEIRAYAENKGYSLNSFINEAIDDKMQKPE